MMINGQSTIALCCIIILIAISFTNCDGLQQNGSTDSIFLSYDHAIVPYTFYDPDTAINLSDELEEVSGLTILPDGTLAVIEDENGILYELDRNGKIQARLEFGDGADYESLEYVDGRYFVMESNGDIHEFLRADPKNAIKTDTEFKGANDVEGLAQLNGNLLVACKANGKVGDYDPEDKAVYLVDAESLEIRELVIDISEKELEEFIRKRHPDVEINDFDPSGIAVDPETRNIYLLSADMILAVFSPEAKLIEVVLLQARDFRQPEGIAFSEDGTLLITSEAAGDLPKLLVFSRK